jgi:diketogulonate reductase-like aldo/keto reductase
VQRWLIQREVVAISKSMRNDRIDENIDVFDFELTQDEMSAIATLDTGMSLFFDHRDPTRRADSAPPGSTSERAKEKEDPDVWLDS